MRPVVAAAPEQTYPETANRPLLTPTRRPRPRGQARPAPLVQQGQFTLLGVTIAGNTRIAMLNDKTSGRIHRVGAART